MTAGFELGSVVADRRIDAIAGQGGMGTVYRAWNLRLKRVEAVKVIAQGFAQDDSFRQRFERETEIAANLDHPHVVTIYDSGVGPGDQLFIAMRYVEGTTLERLLSERKQLKPLLAATLISQIAAALDVAHEQGLVHRDVKPANVLIADRDGRQYAYLTDFGLAKRVASQSSITQAGMMVGTVDYMAPEQAQGSPVDHRADVYALGATLFRALTGQVPFPGEQEVSRLLAKLRDPPPLVSQVAAGVSSAFDSVLARALSLDPDERHGSAGELGRSALAAAGRGGATLASRGIEPGAVLGDCLLEAVVGQGGMGVVYRARQLKLDRVVAIKVMSSELAEDPAFRAQFERECRIAASIDHPNVVPIYWAGEADGRLYVVMQLVEGGSLSDALVREGRLDAGRAVEVIERLAGALSAAHARGLVHRDIKPANVLIDARSGRILLTDFGLAKAIAELDASGDRALGSAHYMPPERARGDAADDVRGDIYALGCVLWDLLGGLKRPALGSVAGLPAGLIEVVDRATATDPADRYDSVDELARSARAAIELGPARPAEPAVVAPEGRQPFAPEPLSSNLSRRVLALCQDGAQRASQPGDRDALLGVHQRLLAPLQVELVGGTEADRRDLVGALVGQPIDAGQSGPWSVGTGLRLGWGSDVAEAFLVLIDDPDGRPDAALRALEQVSATAVNCTCGWLVDQAGQAPLAAAAKRQLGARAAAVVPVDVGLALVGATELVDDALVTQLAEALRGAPPAAERSVVQPLPDQARELLGDGGVQAAAELAGAGQLTVADLRRRLREISGLAELRAELDGLQQRGDALKAAQGLGDLERLSYRDPALGFLRDGVESLRFDPQMHVLGLVQALQRCVAENVELPPGLARQLERLVTGQSPQVRLGAEPEADEPELARAALTQHRQWKSLENGSHASPAVRRVAAVVARSLELTARQLAPPDLAAG